MKLTNATLTIEGTTASGEKATLRAENVQVKEFEQETSREIEYINSICDYGRPYIIAQDATYTVKFKPDVSADYHYTLKIHKEPKISMLRSVVVLVDGESLPFEALEKIREEVGAPRTCNIKWTHTGETLEITFDWREDG